MQECAIGDFYLAIGLRGGDSGKVFGNLESLAELSF